MRHNSNQSEIHPFPEGYPQEGLLEGRNALQEALRSGRTIDKVWVAAGDTDRNLARLTSEAKEQGAVVIPVDRRKLDSMSITHAHQGVIALAAARPYATLDDIFALAESRGEACWGLSSVWAKAWVAFRPTKYLTSSWLGWASIS